MTKYILAGGYVHKADDGGRAFCQELVKGIDKTPVKILVCLFAQPKESWEEKFKGDQEFFSKFISNFDLELATEEQFTSQVKNSDVIFIKGGHTRTLMEFLAKNTEWLEYLDGKVFAGTSAGAEAIAKYYFVTKTMRNGEGLGLLPIKFIPHWRSTYFDDEPQGIDWEKIYSDFKGYKEDLEIVVLKEGEFRVFEK